MVSLKPIQGWKQRTASNRRIQSLNVSLLDKDEWQTLVSVAGLPDGQLIECSFARLAEETLAAGSNHRVPDGSFWLLSPPFFASIGLGELPLLIVAQTVGFDLETRKLLYFSRQID
jgi:hypothetical protein